MKYHSGFFLFFLLFIIIIAGSCSKDKYMNEAVITGFDQRYCACCGGLMINFNGEAKPYKGEFFLVDTPPSQLGIGSTTTFPVHMKVDWVKVSRCNGNYIRIDRFLKQ